jgi:microcystin-dependent protein
MPIAPSPIFVLPGPALGDAASIETALTPLRDRIEAVIDALVPIGVQMAGPWSALPVLPALGGTAPQLEFQWADGGLLTGIGVGNAYKRFFDAVGHAYNAGVSPGANQVRKPDKRGRSILGADAMPGGVAAGRLSSVAALLRAAGSSGGADAVTLSATQIANHSHPIPTRYYTIDNTTTVVSAAGDNGDGPANAMSGRSAPRGSIANTDGVNGGSGGAHTNLHPYEIDNVIVRVR